MVHSYQYRTSACYTRRNTRGCETEDRCVVQKQVGFSLLYLLMEELGREEKIAKIYEGIPWYNGYRISRTWEVTKCSSYRKNRHWGLSIHKWHTCKTAIYNWRPYVSITQSWKRRMVAVSRLVAITYLWLNEEQKPDYHGICVCHKDDNPMNNNVSNLFLWTISENNRDRDQKWRAKTVLSKQDVLSIRSKYTPRKYNMYMLAKEYKVSYFTIYAIIKWISRKNLK